LRRRQEVVEAGAGLLGALPDTQANQRRTLTLLVNQGWVMNALLELPAYYSALTGYEAKAVSLGDPELLGALYARQGWCEWSFGEFDRAIRTTSEATKLCGAGGDGDDVAQAFVHWQWSHMCKGEFHQSLARSADVLRSLAGRTNLRLYLFAVTGASIAYTWLGRWEHAMDEAQKALRAGEEFSDNSVVSMAAWTLSMAYTAKGDLARALEYGEHAVRIAPTPGDKVWASCVLARARCQAGDPGDSLAVLAQGVSALRAARFIWSEVCALWLAEGYTLTGEYEKATPVLEELLAITTRCGMTFLIGCAHRLLAEIAIATNPIQAEEPFAAAHFEQSMAILGAIDAAHELALAQSGYARLSRK
jgi:tetratricopeptide (TPR) repeat protein